MSQLVCFTFQFLLNRVILALVRKYNMELLCLCATDIWPKHEAAGLKKRDQSSLHKWLVRKASWNNIKPIWCVPSKFLLIDKSGEKLHVTPAAFNVLLKPYGILDDQCPVLICKLRDLCGYCKMFSITRRLNTYRIIYSLCQNESQESFCWKHYLQRFNFIYSPNFSVKQQEELKAYLYRQDLQTTFQVCAWTILLFLHFFSSQILPNDSAIRLFTTSGVSKVV